MQALQLFLDSIHTSVWFSVIALLYLCLTLWASAHVLLTMERPASAIAWLGLILLSPGIGFVLYWLLGINRIKRRARREFIAGPPVDRDALAYRSDSGPSNELQHRLMRTGSSIHRDQYIPGNAISPLLNGDQAYPEMLEAIRNASHSIVLGSYIFAYDNIGKRFIQELGEAHLRGVQIRVLIDGVGIGYSFSWTKTDFALRRLGIRTARFLPTLSHRGTRFINLRNHRKILSIDGIVAYLGGINIRDDNLPANPALKKKHATLDLHFKITGSVIDQINALFIDDWQFACGEPLLLPQWQGEHTGGIVCRVLPDGPDDNYHKLHLTLTNAINAAASSIKIITPYFLPDPILLRALELASCRGVTVDVLLPEKSNFRIVDWALRASIRSLLASGINLRFSPAPFDHSKLLLVDDSWSLLGSSNWDARSLELNFEVNLECFSVELNTELTAIFKDKASRATLILENSFSYDSFTGRLRNTFFRLFSPYL